VNAADVSVVVPAYNYGRFLARCLDAALAQDPPAGEILVVDDGSTDDTPGVARRYAGRVGYLRQPNGGLPRARNAGARAARGAAFVFCDADDRLCPGAVGALAAAASAGRPAIVYGRAQEVFEDGGRGAVKGTAAAAGDPPGPARASFWKSIIATSGAALVPRSVFDDVGGYAEPGPAVEDREFWIKAGLLHPFVFLDRVVLEKLAHRGSALARRGFNIYWAMVMQFRVLDWCAARGLDAGTLGATPAGIVDNAVRYLWIEGYWSHLPRALREARRRGVRHAGLWRPLVREAVPAWAGQALARAGRARASLRGAGAPAAGGEGR
jgi:glycosyltransferase involved in cell wall biosynthesis